jgi:hypothetical protein
VCVWGGGGQYAIEHLFFCMNCILNMVPLEAVGEDFVINSWGHNFKHTDIHKLTDKVRSAGSFLDKKPAKNFLCLLKKN